MALSSQRTGMTSSFLAVQLLLVLLLLAHATAETADISTVEGASGGLPTVALGNAHGRLAGAEPAVPAGRAAALTVQVDVTVTSMDGTAEVAISAETGYRPVTTAAVAAEMGDDDSDVDGPRVKQFVLVGGWPQLQPPRVLQSPQAMQQQQWTSSTADHDIDGSSSSSSRPTPTSQAAQDDAASEAAKVVGFQGSDWQCIKKSGCKPSKQPYGSQTRNQASSTGSSRGFQITFSPMLPGGSGECEYFGGCDEVKAQGMCRASWMWEVDATIGAVIQWCGTQCACPGEQQ